VGISVLPACWSRGSRQRRSSISSATWQRAPRFVFLYETTTLVNSERFASRIYRAEFDDGANVFSVETELRPGDIIITDGRTISRCLAMNRAAVAVALTTRGLESSVHSCSAAGATRGLFPVSLARRTS
jgi:hypothetical protein